MHIIQISLQINQAFTQGKPITLILKLNISPSPSQIFSFKAIPSILT